MIQVHSSDQLRHLVYSRLRTWFPTPDEPVLDLNDLDVSSVVSMESVFAMLNRPVDVSKWDTRQVKDFSQCFYRANAVPDISNWNVDHATNFREMFAYASVYEPLNLTQWDMQGPRDIRRMFFQTSGQVDTRRWAFGESVIWDWESAPPNWQKTPEAPWFWMFALAKAHAMAYQSTVRYGSDDPNYHERFGVYTGTNGKITTSYLDAARHRLWD